MMQTGENILNDGDHSHDIYKNTSTFSSENVDRSPLGFSNDLRLHLQSSRMELDKFIEAQKELSDKCNSLQDQIVQNERCEIKNKLKDLRGIQYKRGHLDIPSSDRYGLVNDGEDSNLVEKAVRLKEKEVQIEKEIANLNLEHSEKQRQLEEISKVEQVERHKADQVRKSKERVEEAKKTSVDDLTYAVLKYKMLGIDFVKGVGSALRCNFTHLDPVDPNRIFTFLLNVNDDDLYEINECNPELNAGTILTLLDELNTTESFQSFICGIRRAFKESLI